MTTSSSSGAVRFLAGAATVLLVLGSAVGLFILISGAAGKGPGDVAIHQQVDGSHLRGLPSAVTRPTAVNVTVRLRHASAHQRRIAAARDFSVIPIVLAFLWFGRAILLSVRDGDPFTEANVRRLRTIGFLCLIGVPLTTFFGSFFNSALADSTPLGLGSPVNFSTAGPFASIGVFALAEVFAQGVRLRQDVEGTV